MFAKTVADVQIAVRAARNWNLALAVRSGGHSYAGYSVGSGLVLDLSLLHAVTLDLGGGGGGGEGGKTDGGDAGCSVLVQSGAKWMSVYEALGEQALVVGGGCGSVGVGGYTLGGGLGYLSRVYGMAIDNVLACTVVTAAGDVVTLPHGQSASSSSGRGGGPEGPASELFWALNGGGGGNFGVMVDVRFRCHTPPDRGVAGASFTWAPMVPEAVEAVLAFYASWLPGLPDAMSAYVAITKGALGVTFFYLGAPADGQVLLGPWRALFKRSPRLAPSTTSAMQGMSFLDFERTQQGPGLGNHQRNVMSSAMVPEITSSVVAGLLELVAAMPKANGGDHTGIYAMHAGGAVGRVHRNATAFPHRDAVWVVGVEGLWDASAQDARYLDWAQLASARLARLGNGAYVNYADPNLPAASWPEMYYGSNYVRLQKAKCAWDPENIFGFEQGVRCGNPI